MTLNHIQSKIKDNKIEKEKKLFNSALKLFTEKGINNTSISDITNNAGLAKGTFYLYFKDKYELQNVLLTKTSRELFASAHQAASKKHFDRLDERIIFIIDYIIDYLKNDLNIIKFLQKNLSLGLYGEKINDLLDNQDIGIKEVFIQEVHDRKIPLDNPEITLFMIIELVSSTVSSSIVDNHPLPIDEFKPHLFHAIRLMINEKPAT